jgi:signal transduction histidine kinase
VSGGLWWFQDDRHGQVRNDGLDRDLVYSLTGGDNDLWIGRRRGGLTHLQLAGGAFTSRTYTQRDGLAQDSVYAVERMRDGSVWAGTLSGGVSKFESGRFTTYREANGLGSNTVVAILEAADGTVWFATPNGASAFSQGKWRTFTVRDGLPSNDVNCLLETRGSVLLAGTSEGIASRATDRFGVPDRIPPPLREPVYGMAEDRRGWLWIATARHLLRVNRDRLLSGTLADGDISEFGIADGLRGTEGVKRHRSLIRDPAGRIWVSLNLGISVIDPARLSAGGSLAIPHVESLSSDGRAIPLSESVHVSGTHQRVTLAFAGLSLSVPERVRFRYRLDPFDRDWSNPSSTPEAAYTNLSPGNYRFRVVAGNREGVWSAQEATIAFTIEPLMWESWWFRAGVVAALAGFGFLAYRLRVREMTRRMNVRFEERLAERTRIAQELHDTLLQGFLSASMQVHVATDDLPAETPAKKTLTRALQLMTQVIDEGRNALRGLRAASTTAADLESAFARVPQEVATGSQNAPQFRIIVEGDVRVLRPMLRDEVYRIGREALVNAFRHAHAQHIEIELKYARSLHVTVRDDGRGIDAKILKEGRAGHFGLSGMRERADRIGAELHLSTSASAGTELTLIVPGRVAFEPTARRVPVQQEEHDP